jgi:hypothetical protein
LVIAAAIVVVKVRDFVVVVVIMVEVLGFLFTGTLLPVIVYFAGRTPSNKPLQLENSSVWVQVRHTVQTCKRCYHTLQGA